LAGNDSAAEKALHGSSVLLALAACFLAVVWLTEIVGDPTDGLAFYTLAFGAPVLLGSGLVIAASRRRDLFGSSGLAGAIAILVGSLSISILGFAAAVIGVILIGAAVARRAPRLLPGLLLLGIGVLGLTLRMDYSEDAYTIFIPMIAVGAAVLAATLRRL
jgi:hypothetical protein